MAISVVVAVGAIADPLVEAMATRARRLKIGPGDQPASEMGPLITAEHRERVAAYLDSGCVEGATLAVDGREAETPQQGFFLGASLFDRVTTDMRIYTDEIFGPVLCVVRVSSYDAALAVLAGHPYGNGAAVFTRDGGAARRFQRDVEVGMVGINVPIPVPVAYHSFGGWRDSLFGSAPMYGPEGIRFYSRAQVITTRWPEPEGSRVDLGFPRNR